MVSMGLNFYTDEGENKKLFVRIRQKTAKEKSFKRMMMMMMIQINGTTKRVKIKRQSISNPNPQAAISSSLCMQ
jgi:hypothetical protein